MEIVLRLGEGVNYSRNIINKVIGIVKIIGVFLATAMLIFIGIKWMIASPDGKAEAKKQLTFYIAGAAVMYGSAAILQLIQTFVIEATNNAV